MVKAVGVDQHQKKTNKIQKEPSDGQNNKRRVHTILFQTQVGATLRYDVQDKALFRNSHLQI